MKQTKKILIITISLLLIFGTSLAVYAKYIKSIKQNAEITTAEFHISSNYLTPNNDLYNLTSWSSGFDVALYNYEISNISLLSENDITYTVSVSDGWKYTVDGVSASSYILTGGSKNSSVINITPDGDKNVNDKVTVTVTTSSPFAETISATFIVKNVGVPDYTLSDNGDGTSTLIVNTNDYAGSITVKWKASTTSADNTNDLESAWLNENVGADSYSYGVFDAQSNSTYTLKFFNNATVSGKTGSGTEIIISD